jgi:hypothetical protein
MSKENMSVLPWVVELAVFTYQIVLQSIFMTKKYELKNTSTFVTNILSWQNATLTINICCNKYD